MRRMRKKGGLGLLALLTLALAAIVGDAPARGATREYVVVYEHGADAAEARAAVERAGGKVVDENPAVGVATVRSRADGLRRERAGAGRRCSAPPRTRRSARRRRAAARRAATSRARSTGRSVRQRTERAQAAKPAEGEPLAGLQWDMAMIGATADRLLRAASRASATCSVGVIDTGIDASHPDIAPNFDRGSAATSRSTTRSSTALRRRSGRLLRRIRPTSTRAATARHVAGTIGAALNGFGIAGVAPKVSLVNLRAGQDSGYFFLRPDARRAHVRRRQRDRRGEHDLLHRPVALQLRRLPGTDPPGSRREQATVIEATQRALTYARNKGVTLVGSMGNGFTDKTRPVSDYTSPDYPPGAERTAAGRQQLPDDAERGRRRARRSPRSRESKRKAYYSDYGYGRRTSPRRAATATTTRRRRRPRAQAGEDVLRRTRRRSRASRGDLVDEAGQPDERVRREGLPEGRLRLLPLPQRHVDGVAARGRASPRSRCRASASGGHGGFGLDAARDVERDAPRHGDRHAVPGAAYPTCIRCSTRSTPRRARAPRTTTGSTATASWTPPRVAGAR